MQYIISSNESKNINGDYEKHHKSKNKAKNRN